MGVTRRALSGALALAALLGLYLVVLRRPVRGTLEGIRQETAAVEGEIESALAARERYELMGRELRGLSGTEGGGPMPEYDNLPALVAALGEALEGTGPRLTFDDVIFRDGAAVRRIRFSFSAASFSEAREVLARLTGTGFRSLLEGLSIIPEEGDIESGEVRVSGTITFYETCGGRE